LTLIQDGGEKEIRGNLHLFLRAGSGNFKSTMLKELAAYFKVDVIESLTSAGLVGSIDKNMNIIPGMAWKVRNKMLLLDEFETEGSGNCVKPLLSLLEDQEYKKSFGRHANDRIEKEKDLFFRVKSGAMYVKTRFSCVICSMKNIEKSRSQNVGALLSRCVLVPYSLEDEEIERVVHGHKLLKIKSCPFKKPFDFEVSGPDYKEILSVINTYPGLNKKKQYGRIICDCCRAFAVLGKHDPAIYLMITKLHQEV